MNKEDSKKYLNQKFQEFIFNLNQPYLKGGVQSAYTNVSILDREHLKGFFEDKYYPNGELILNYEDEIIEFQNSFLDYVGNLRKEKWHTFPVISASLVYKDGEYKDEETAKMVVNHNWKFGFNDVNIMRVDEVTSAASCCRLTSNTKEIGEGDTFNSIGGSDLNIGSSKVVDHNLVRLAILSDNEEDFYHRVRENTKLIHKYHYCHRKILKKLIDKGLLPMYSSGMMDLNRQFATVGIGGVYEAVKVQGGIKEDNQGVYYSDKGYEIAENMFKVIKEENEQTYDKYGFKANIEQSPNESAAVKLNKKDRMMFGNRKINKLLSRDCYIYGNQWIPLKENTNIFRRVEAAKLDEHCGGGAILHLNLGENFNSFEDAWKFEKELARKGVKYSSLISLIDICKEDHSFFGDTCPICGSESVSKGIKIVGYLVKQNSYKEERKQELNEREFYDLN